ncbi:gastrula zinc finger protein XlCGF58.1-like isoform X5 [Corythoichthys intestinalis]|uniref:gastrula zinc finger protein XlCGF58.1-like isoform X5 n=1 Tax=Corythoichthys intestinalis TaxID=161448 RepID=UPI0025A5A650|nr:gastrula zinc finger protein XlCGF58.1-like isoform X5 [Corythoichthys intestinalis]
MERQSDYEARTAETFRSQAALIMEVAVEAAAEVLQRTLAGGQGQAPGGAELKSQLTAILSVATKEAIRQICTVFSQLLNSLAKDNDTLKDKVGRMEAELRDKQTSAAEKTKTADTKRPVAPPPMSLTMSIINSAKVSASIASGARGAATAQVPVVMISQPLHDTFKIPSGPLTTPSEPNFQECTSDEEGTTVMSLPAANEQQKPEELVVATDEMSLHVTEVEKTETVIVKSEEEMVVAHALSAVSEEDLKEQENKRRRELYKHKRFFCEAKTLHKHQQFHRLREAQERDPDNMLACEQCDRKFRMARQLRAHQAFHRLEKAPLRCATCGRTFTSAAVLRYHEISHSDVKPFICDVCGKGFLRKKSLREHQTVHTGARPYPCQTCGKRFSTTGNLRVHKRSHSDERPFKCGECDKTFKCRMGLLQHHVVHSGEKPFVCQTCGLSFGLKYNFQRHMRLHSGEKPFKCEKCGEGFTGTWALKSHMLVHGVEKPFMCDLCGKTFFYNCQLQKHQLLVHENKECGKSGGTKRRRRPSSSVNGFICKSCGKSLSSISTLRTHEKSHAEHKEFICETCGKSFHLRHLYIYHMRQHSGDRPHVCGVCQKGFLLQSQLRQHELLHTGVKPHKCQQCGKAFRTSQNYHRHLLVHTGEKPYECATCGRKFRQSNQLKSHMQIHTGVKLYSCQSCERGFSDSRQLKKHRCGDGLNGSLKSGSECKKETSQVFQWSDGFVNQ